jgi:MFS family permease
MASSNNKKDSQSTTPAIGSLGLSMLLASSGTSIPNVALPELAREFSVSIPEVQWVILAYLLAVTSLIVGAGRLGDALGRRNVLLSGVLLFTVSALLCGIAPNLGFLIASRALQGVGGAVLMALTVATASEIVPERRLGRSMGLLGTMSAVGTAIGPTVGGLLITWGGWRSIFLAMVPIGALLVVLMYRYLPSPGAKTRPDPLQLDLAGTFLLAVALTAYALTMTVGGGQPNLMNGALLVLASASATLFCWNERKVRSPLVPWAALRDADVLANLTMNFLVSCVMMSTLVVGPFYLSHGLKLSVGTVGLVMSVGPITSMLTGIPAGWVVDRRGPSLVMVLGLVELGVGAFVMSWLPPRLGIAGYVIAAVLMSPGYQMFQAANNAGVMNKVNPVQRGVISGMLGLSRNLGLITGTAVMGAVFSNLAYTSQTKAVSIDALERGLRVTFTTAAVLAFLALIIAACLSLRRQAPDDEVRALSG